MLLPMHQQDQLPWPVNVRAILQPAEELAIGAKHMVEHGAIEGVDSIFALHVDPTRPVGHIGLRAGLLTAACDIVRVTFKAFHDVMRAQGDAIKKLERAVDSKADRREAAAALSAKANAADVSMQLHDLEAQLHRKADAEVRILTEFCPLSGDSP